MNLPSGLVFFLDFQYGTTKNPFTATNSLYGNRTSAQYPFATPAPAGGLYGAGRFTYSTNQTSSVPSALAGNNQTIAAGKISTASWLNVGYDTALSASVARGEIKAITIGTSSIPNYDPDAIRGFIIASGSSGYDISSSFYPQFTQAELASGTITFFATGSIAGGLVEASTVTIYYNKATADNKRGDFEDTTGANSYSVPNAQSTSVITIPEINISMQSQAITAKTKKLKAAWTPEFAQDLNAYQNLDAEAELTNIMSEYISLEIDLEILDMLIQDVPSNNIEYWSAINNVTADATTPPTQSLGFYNTQGAWFQTLGTKVNKISNKIHQLTLRGGANFMVVSPTVSTILESIPGFAANANGAEDMEYAFGVQKAGQFNSRYTVYKNPYMTENVILVGFRGKQFLEAGAVFAPYIPLIMTPLIYDPSTFTPRKGLLTRFAKKMLRPEFYGKIFINGLNTL
jgi:hypothetical protein